MTSISARNLEILSLFDAGETLESIGQKFSLTRERVRQIAAENGRKPRLPLIMDKTETRRKRIIEAWGAGKTNPEIAAEIGVCVTAVSVILGENDIKANRLTLSEEIKLMQAAARVKSGASIRKVGSSDNIPLCRLARRLKESGVESRHGRWRDLSHREDIVRAGRKSGRSWKKIAAELENIECRKVSPQALSAWAKTNVPEVINKHEKCRTSDIGASQATASI
ncbi:hypothetical protein V5G24_20240 [Xanthobacter sp. VTT E-85241]|uniref:hypothetical protein n=1 Tax=Roseixanthobacter finlandensis TaxID=3119922 RepID=UPI003726DBE6